MAVASRLSEAQPVNTNYYTRKYEDEKLFSYVLGAGWGIFLHPVTVLALLGGFEDAFMFQSWESVFEAFPQFVLQTYSILLFGFGFTATGTTLGLPSNVIDPVMKILGIVTSFSSIVHGVNSRIVDDNFPQPLAQRDILKCSLYTLPDLLFRLLLFPVCWLLLGGYAIIVSIIITVVWMAVYFCVSKQLSGVQIFNILIINIAPQSAASFKEKSGFEPGKLWILAKLFSNAFFFVVTISLHLLLHLDTASTVLDTERLSAQLPANYSVSNCNSPSSYQEQTYANHLILDFGFFFIVYACLVVSSLEIIFFFFNPKSWRQFLVGNLSDEEFEAARLKKIVTLQV